VTLEFITIETVAAHLRRVAAALLQDRESYNDVTECAHNLEARARELRSQHEALTRGEEKA
jgi:hypothetical protein